MSVKQDKQRGTWTLVVDVLTGDGKRHQVRRRGFKTKNAAEKAQRDIENKAEAGLYVPKANMTVGEYLDEVWLPGLDRHVRATTADSYRRLARLHIVPKLGPAVLQALDEPTVRRWVDGLAKSGLSAKSVHNVHGVLSSALSEALDMRLVSRNAANRAKLPTVPPRKPRAWSTAELRTFLRHIEGDRWAPMWRLLATTGMRRGEVLGLRWRDLDLDAGVLVVAQQRAIAGGRVVQGPPKTGAGARSVALDDVTVAALRAWRKQQHEERLRMGAGWPDTGGLVFVWPDGSPPWPQRVTEWFRAHAEVAGLPNIGVHGLRHTAATWLIASGESPKVVAQRLGHAHVSVTLQLYSHVMPAHDRAAADALAAALDNL